MTDASQLPWDTTDGGDMHARATALATAAMNAASDEIPADGGDYARAQARYQADLARMRSASAQGHLEANNARAEAARIVKAERQAAHLARIAKAKADAAARKADKAA